MGDRGRLKATIVLKTCALLFSLPCDGEGVEEEAYKSRIGLQGLVPYSQRPKLQHLSFPPCRQTPCVCLLNNHACHQAEALMRLSNGGFVSPHPLLWLLSVRSL